MLPKAFRNFFLRRAAAKLEAEGNLVHTGYEAARLKNASARLEEAGQQIEEELKKVALIIQRNQIHINEIKRQCGIDINKPNGD